MHNSNTVGKRFREQLRTVLQVSRGGQMHKILVRHNQLFDIVEEQKQAI